MFKLSFMIYHAEIAHLNWNKILRSEYILVRALMIAIEGVTISVGIFLFLFILKCRKSGGQ